MPSVGWYERTFVVHLKMAGKTAQDTCSTVGPTTTAFIAGGYPFGWPKLSGAEVKKSAEQAEFPRHRREPSDPNYHQKTDNSGPYRPHWRWYHPALASYAVGLWRAGPHGPNVKFRVRRTAPAT